MTKLTEEEIMEEMKVLQEMEAEDLELDRIGLGHESSEIYGGIQEGEKHNQHTFLKETTKQPDVDRFTYLNEEETGRPLFSMRFMLDYEGISKHYLDKYLKDIGQVNKISNYWRRKINNVTTSGMSKEGFIQMMNITRKIDTTRKSSRGNIDNLQGGKKK